MEPLLRADAIEIVRWVLGVAVLPSPHDPHGGELVEGGVRVGVLLVGGAARRGRFSWHDASISTPASLVNDLVEPEAWRGRTRASLRVAPPLVGHLFVWVDDADHRVRAAMGADETPSTPSFPPEVGVVWVARRPIVRRPRAPLAHV